MPTLKLVVDTNIVFSAIIRPGRLRDLLFDPRLTLYAPEELALELELLQDRIVRYTTLSPAEAGYVKRVLLSRVITVVPRSRYLEEARRALALLSSTDPSDAPFIGLAIHLDAPLWTGDKTLIRLALETGEYRAVDTRALEMLLEGRPWSEVEESLRGRYLYRRGRPA